VSRISEAIDRRQLKRPGSRPLYKLDATPISLEPSHFGHTGVTNDVRVLVLYELQRQSVGPNRELRRISLVLASSPIHGSHLELTSPDVRRARIAERK
jgi:hypothetical protein